MAFIAITTFAAASSGIAAGYQADRNGGEFWSWEGFGRGAVAGAISGAAGYGMGSILSVNAESFVNGLWRGALSGAFTGGMTGALSTGMMGGDIGKGFFNGMISGGISGALTTGVSGGMAAQEQGRNFWNGGKALKLKPPIEADPLMTASGAPAPTDDPTPERHLPETATRAEHQASLEEFDKQSFSNYEYRDQVVKLKYKKRGNPSIESKSGMDANNTDEWLGSNTPRIFGKGYRVEIYQKAFESSDILFNTLGHEYIEVGLHYNGLLGTWPNHYASSKWENNKGQLDRYKSGNDLNEYLSTGRERYSYLKKNNYFGISPAR